MLHAVLLAGIAGGIAAVGLWKHQKQSAVRRQQVYVHVGCLRLYLAYRWLSFSRA